MRSYCVLGLILVVCALFMWFSDFGQDLLSPEALPEERVSLGTAIEGEGPIRVITRSIFNEEYASPARTIRDDLESVMDLITDCQLTIKNFDSQFLPDNQAITSFLQGRNAEKIAWIPPSHSLVSDDGELMDRNKVPLFFHRESGLQFQIRSAGGDRVMWTKDDVVHPERSKIPQED